MNLKSKEGITTKQQYLKQVAYLESLAQKGEKNLSSAEMKNMHTIAIALEVYEDAHLMGKKHSPDSHRDQKQKAKTNPSLVEIVEFKMFQKKMTQVKLAELIGQPPSKVSKILNKQRDPDVPFLKAIHEKLHIDGNFILESV